MSAAAAVRDRSASGSRGAPRLVLGARALAGMSRASRDRLIEMNVRTQEPEALAVTLSKAIDAGAEAVLVAPSPQLRAALAELQRRVPLLAVLPTREWHEELELDPGLAPLLDRARARAPAGARVRGAFTALARLPGVMRGDWAALLPLLIELETARLPRGELAGVVVSAEVADAALATRNAKLFARATEFVHRRYAVPVGFETRNLGVMIERLHEWDVAPDFVVGPVNPSGYGMKPNAPETLSAIARRGIPVLATELRAGGRIDLSEGVAYARSHGVHGLAPDLVDLDDVPGELRTLARG